MQTKEIKRNEWPAFFDSFSNRHQSWIVNVEIFGPEIGDQIEERQLALQGITAELDGQEGDTVLVMAGAKADDHITHSIARAAQVNVEQTDEGAERSVAIVAEDGTTTLLRFTSPPSPEIIVPKTQLLPS